VKDYPTDAQHRRILTFTPSATGLDEPLTLTAKLAVICHKCGRPVAWVFDPPIRALNSLRRGEQRERDEENRVSEHLVPLAEIETEAHWGIGASGIELNGEVRPDWAGRPSVPAERAALLYATLVEARDRWHRESFERMLEAEARRPVRRGIPAEDGLTATAMMFTHAERPPWKQRISPSQEWLDSIGRPQ
jgi:hypothetical protein